MAHLPTVTAWAKCQDMLSRTTLHGLPQLQSKFRRVKRAIWACILLTTVGLVCINTVNLITEYRRMEVNVMVTIESSRQLLFPAVTICNANPIKKSALEAAATNNEALQSLLAIDSPNRWRKRRKRAVTGTWCPANDLCFHKSTSEYTWSDGKAYCESIGYIMASIRSQTEQDGVCDNLGCSGYIYFGALFFGSKWSWVDGYDYDSGYKKTALPSTPPSSSRCGHMLDAVWGEHTCDHRHYILCRDVDECSSSPCINGATCNNQINQYTCTCPPGYTGTNCQTDVDQCSSSPCINGATCNNQINQYTCTCIPGYTGTNCQTEIECASSPCQNEATCHEEINSYTCLCAAGYTGQHCETDIVECDSTTCLFGATCSDAINGYTCSCVPGYTGVHCETDIDECLSIPCMYGAMCNARVNGYTCTCVPGYTGLHCETDIDECTSSPCAYNSTCTDLVSGYTCNCSPGYSETNCQTEIDECRSTPCQHNAKCNDYINGYSCNCTAGYNGTHCEIDIDECLSNPCMHGAMCNARVSGYTCTCVPGYTGVHCETDIDECKSLPCQNHARCIDQIHFYDCDCPSGYEGKHCEKIIPGKEEPIDQTFAKEQEVTNILSTLSNDDKKSIGYSITDIIADCRYDGRSCNISLEFHEFYNAIHGNCYTFNSGKENGDSIKYARQAGRRNGLEMMINIGQAEFVKAAGSQAGALVLVHHPSTMPFPEDHGMMLRPGLYNLIALREMLISRKPQPYSNCITDDMDTDDRNAFSDVYRVSYSKKACLRTCYQRHTMDTCDCAVPQFPRVGRAFGNLTVGVCDDANDIQKSCKGTIESEYAHGTLECDCPMSCSESVYLPTVSNAKWPMTVHLEYIISRLQTIYPDVFVAAGSNATLKDFEKILKNNFLKFNVYYEDLSHEVMSEVPVYPMFSLISDLGGMLGLFLGMSSMTLLEVAEFLIGLCILLSRGGRHTAPLPDTKSNMNRSMDDVTMIGHQQTDHPSPSTSTDAASSSHTVTQSHGYAGSCSELTPVQM